MPAAASPLVTVVVLSYNRPALLEKALASVAAQTYPALEVIIIDNASAASPKIRDIARVFPSFRLIANDDNRGFTGGMNQGLEHAAGPFIYFTEDDIELAPDCVALLVDYLQHHPETGLAGPVMWNRQEPSVRCAGGRIELGSVYRLSIAGQGERALEETQPFETMFLPGAAIAAPTDLFRDLGGFRDDFFMYREDVELCVRVQHAGRAIIAVPAARVYHHEPTHGAESAVLAFHKSKNLAALYFLHAPLRVLPGFILRYGALGLARTLASDPANLPAFIKSWCWALGRAPRLFSERRNHRSAAPKPAIELKASN